MKFKLHELYANVYFRDVLFYVVEFTENYDGTVTIYGSWWNKGQSGKPWPMNVTQEITIAPKQFRDWARYAS
jgi:hypothetical protein